MFQVEIQNMYHLKERIRDAYAHIASDVLERVNREWE
jgi:hypothetical protein